MSELSNYPFARATCALLCMTMLPACGPSDDIDPDGAVFNNIKPDAVITLVGTEPFWTFEISPLADGKYIARYTTPEITDGTRFSVARFAGNNGIGFSGELEGSPVQIAITPGKCSDGMSDRTFPYTATVAIGDTVIEGCGQTSDEPVPGPSAR